MKFKVDKSTYGNTLIMMISKLVISAQKRNLNNTVNTRENITYQNLPGEQQKTKQQVDNANK